MCELFGICSNKSVKINFTLRGFIRRGTKHRSGWGVGWYLRNKDGKTYAALVKEPRSSINSPIARLLKDGIESHIVISHVRYATKGKERYVNTHPFVRAFGEDEWIFAHNGTVSIEGFHLEKYHPIGDTDSEYAFCYILDNLQENLKLNDFFRKLYGIVKKIGKCGEFNFLMSNGKYLFAHTTNKKLYYLRRHPPHTGIIKLKDEDFEISLEEMKGEDEYVVLLATVPLTDENWIKLENRKIYVFSDGDPILRIESNKYSLMLNKKEIEILKAIKKSSIPLELSKIAEYIGEDIESTYKIIKGMVHRRYLKQHQSGKTQPNHPKARYFIRKDKMDLIDLLTSA